MTTLSPREQVRQYTEAYRSLYVQEYEAFKAQTKMKRDTMRDQYATIKGGDFVERALVDFPETLFEMFTDDCRIYLRDKDALRWFARAFPEFRLADKI